jgi:hypothetical protein
LIGSLDGNGLLGGPMFSIVIRGAAHVRNRGSRCRISRDDYGDNSCRLCPSRIVLRSRWRIVLIVVLLRARRAWRGPVILRGVHIRQDVVEVA